MIPLNKIKIDSLHLVIDADKVKLNYHSTFLREITSINPEGEIVYTTKPTRYKDPDSLAAIEYKYRSFNLNEGPKFELFISSKALGASYFQGLNKDTIKAVFNKVESEGIIEISKEDFLAAQVRDVDFCYDEYLQNTKVKDVVLYCSKLVRPTTRADLGKNVFTKDNNQGIEFGKRNKVGKAYRQRQYLKFYGKALELVCNSTDFYDEYIKPQIETIDVEGNKQTNKFFNLEKLIRIETTIKNKEHFASYGLRIETLREALLLLDDQTLCAGLFNRPINVHMVARRFVKPQLGIQIKPTDKALLIALAALAKDLSLSKVEAIPFLADELYGGLGSSSNVARMRRKLEHLYDHFDRPFALNSSEAQKTIFDDLSFLPHSPTSDA